MRIKHQEGKREGRPLTLSKAPYSLTMHRRALGMGVSRPHLYLKRRGKSTKKY